MTYFKLFAKCLAIATKQPLEEIEQRFREYIDHVEPNAIMSEEAPAHIVKRLLNDASTDPLGLVKFGLKGIDGFLEVINRKPKH
jgi:hypothetical protein